MYLIQKKQPGGFWYKTILSTPSFQEALGLLEELEYELEQAGFEPRLSSDDRLQAVTEWGLVVYRLVRA